MRNKKKTIFTIILSYKMNKFFNQMWNHTIKKSTDCAWFSNNDIVVLYVNDLNKYIQIKIEIYYIIDKSLQVLYKVKSNK